MSDQGQDIVNCLWKQIEELLSLPSDEREESDIKNVSTWFRNRSSLFDIDKNSLHGIIQQADVVRIKADQIIVHQGDVGSCFYIILRGSVGIYAKKVSSQTEEIVVLPDVTIAKGAKERSRFGHELNLLRAGRCFGELSVIGKHSTRNASVIADEPTLLVSVSKQLYSQYVCEDFAAEIAQRSSFIAMHPLFRGWQATYRNLLSENLQYRRLKFGEHIVRQGKPLDAVFFIIEGQAKLKVNPVQHANSFKQLFEKINVSSNDDQESDDDAIDPFKPITVMERRKLKQTESFYASELRYREMDVCTLGPQGLIGDIESILDLNQHISTAVCLQEISLYEMDKSSFVRFIVKKNPETYEKMRRSVYEKLLYRNQMFSGGIPIYKTLLMLFDKPKPKDNRKQILSTYNLKKSKKKPISGNFFEELSKGRSTNYRPRKQSIQPVRRPIYEALQPREGEEDDAVFPVEEEAKVKKKLHLMKAAGKVILLGVNQGKTEKVPKQFTSEEYKELKKKLQAAGKTA